MRSALLWLQGDAPAKLRVEFWPADSDGSAAQVLTALRPAEDFVAHLELAPLEPGREYRYRVLFDDQEVASGKFSSAPQWRWRGDPPNFRVLLGSCVYLNDPDYDRPGKPYGGGYDIFDSMAAQAPQLTLWLGDNLYFREADYASPWGMGYRYKRDRGLPQLQALLRTGQHAAIWDDHDYGPNDANGSFIFKSESLRLFQRYWANPSYGLPGVPGVFTVVHQGDADFFLLDNRWYRDSDRLKIESGKAMFGPAQLRWLKNALLQSTATFKLIAGGSQFLNDGNRYEGWNHFPEERAEFLDWLAKQGLRGVFFLSGDRHFTELLTQPRGKLYSLTELTCSPLTSSAFASVDESGNPNVVKDTVVRERNFCSLDFRGPQGQREMVVRSLDRKGKTLWEKIFSERDLGHEAAR